MNKQEFESLSKREKYNFLGNLISLGNQMGIYQSMTLYPKLKAIEKQLEYEIKEASFPWQYC